MWNVGSLHGTDATNCVNFTTLAELYPFVIKAQVIAKGQEMMKDGN